MKTFTDIFKEFGRLKVTASATTQNLDDNDLVIGEDNTLDEAGNSAETQNIVAPVNDMEDFHVTNITSRTIWYSDLFTNVSPTIIASSNDKTLKILERIQVAETVSENKSWITSIMPMPHNYLIVADKTDGALKLLKGGKIVSRTTFSSYPWDITKINETCIAVTYPQMNRIFFFNAYFHDVIVKIITTVSLLGSPLKCESSIKIRRPCFGITCLGKSLVVSCEDCIQMYSLKGKLLDTVNKNVDGKPLFSRATFLSSDKFRDVVFVSDEGANSVSAIQCAHKTFVSSPKYIYLHPKLRCPQGIAVADDGSILVSGFGSKNIHKISTTGILLEVFEMTVRPWALAFLNGTNQCIVSIYPEEEDCSHIYCLEMSTR